MLSVKRKFVTNLLLLLSLNLLVKPIWIFGIDRTVQNVVGAGEYGLFFALFNFSILLNIALDFGLTNFNNREISQNPQVLPRYFSNLIGLKLMLATVYFVISFVAALALGYSGRQIWLLLFLTINQFLSSFILYLRSNISGLQLFRTDSFLSVADRILMILLCGVLLWSPLSEHFVIEWFVYAQTLAYLITAAVAFIVVLRKVNTFSLSFNRAFLISIARQSFPYALLVLLMSFHYRVDSVMLERMLPDGHIQAGIYAQAFRLLDASVMIPFLFSTLLLPIFSRMLRLGDSVDQLLRLALSILLMFAIVFATACIVHREAIMDLLYGNSTGSSATIFAILMVSFVFSSVSYILGTLLTANGNLTLLNFIALTGVAVNVTLNLLLIPRIGAVGAAASSLITHLVVAVMQAVATYRLFIDNIPWRAMVKFLGFVITFLFLSFFALKLSVPWGVSIIIIMLAGGISGLIFGVLRAKELLSLFLHSPE